MIARTMVGRTLAVALAIGLSHVGIPLAQATPRIVSQSEMAARLLENAQSREQRIRLFQEALGVPEVQARARTMGLDPVRLQSAIPHLSDAELAELAARASKVEDVTAGHYRRGGGNEGLVILGVALLLTGLIILAVLVEDDYDDWDDCDCWY
ncbi:MAG: hypothetical protein JXO72_13655 [Vicinamibacteria bacterium]|nr:hypothetical protein [Vicinamibacteria bacterium]